MAQRYRCIDCRKVRNGTVGKTLWCDCGGELRPLYPARRRKKTKRE